MSLLYSSLPSLHLFWTKEERKGGLSKEARHSVNRSYLSHCPIHGPHALASTMAPISLNGLSNPSLSMVALICSEPGVTVNWVLYNSNHGNILRLSNHTHIQQSLTTTSTYTVQACAWASSTSTVRCTSEFFQALASCKMLQAPQRKQKFDNENFWKYM